jgi:hypothetical protein
VGTAKAVKQPKIERNYKKYRQKGTKNDSSKDRNNETIKENGKESEKAGGGGGNAKKTLY